MIDCSPTLRAAQTISRVGSDPQFNGSAQFMSGGVPVDDGSFMARFKARGDRRILVEQHKQLVREQSLASPPAPRAVLVEEEEDDEEDVDTPTMTMIHKLVGVLESTPAHTRSRVFELTLASGRFSFLGRPTSHAYSVFHELLGSRGIDLSAPTPKTRTRPETVAIQHHTASKRPRFTEADEHTPAPNMEQVYTEYCEESEAALLKDVPPPMALPGKTATRKHVPKESLGCKLLQKLGWTPGTGLGKHSSGTVEPVAVSGKYSTGLGLGASRLS